MSTPQSTIYICSGVRLDNRYEHSIYFPSADAQQEYFAGKVVKTFPAYSYLRKTWPIQVEATMEQAKTWSYLFFRNGTGKYYYYFITQIEYKNDHMVELTLELDVLQTYLFDFEMLDCFVERQHTETDEIGEHLLDEGLELGELTINDVRKVSMLRDHYCIMVLASINLKANSKETCINTFAASYNKIFSGLKLWAIHQPLWSSWGAQLDRISSWGKMDGIVAMWMYPRDLVQLADGEVWHADSTDLASHCAKLVADVKPYIFSDIPNSQGTLNGHTPKNNKLFAYPFNMLYVSNNNGSDAIYRYENFIGTPMFQCTGALSPDSGVRLRPYHYNGSNKAGEEYTDYTSLNDGEGLTLPPFPSCAWDSDTYKMWLAQNQSAHNAQNATAGLMITAGAIATVGSIFTGGTTAAVGLGMMYSGFSQINNLMAAKKDMSVQPPQARGSFSSSLAMTCDTATFTFYNKSVKKEIAAVIDNYFTMYGYKLNRIRKPNLCARPSFTFIKTVGCNIKDKDSQHGMCTEDRVKITGIFDRGITFWVNGDQIADYTQDNSV